MGNTIKSTLTAAKQLLTPATNTPDLDAELLLAHVLQSPRASLYTWPEKELSPTQLQQYESYLTRRQNGEPIAYITGIKEFWSLELQVTTDTLIPRPETELLVETVLQHFTNQEKITLADLGTGSGAVALAIAHERPHWILHATDKSEQALAIAKQNATRLQLGNVHFHLGSWCAALPENKFDAIVSNPPYISVQEWNQYEADLQHEPIFALLAEKNGLADIEEIVMTAKACLKPGGYLFLEHGFTQGAAVRQLFVSSGYSQIETVRDLANKERVTLGKLTV